jgi:nitroimidazol reductase NimA-like FMN-containing flavoprotein (pyridoxamine 5'-phosphate oxidase superfamily)
VTDIPTAEPMPWPDYEPDGGDAELLPWSWAVERLQACRTHWLATARADGSAHLRPVWAAWSDGALAFSTGRTTRKARNLANDARCSMAVQEAGGSVVVDGVAAELTDPAARERADAAYKQKYGSSMQVGDSPVFAVRPIVVVGINEDGGSLRPTRWRP